MMRLIGPVINFVDRPWKVCLSSVHGKSYFRLHLSRCILWASCLALVSPLPYEGNSKPITIGFDTASSIALLAVSALAKKGSNGESIPAGDIIILPVSLVVREVESFLITISAIVHGRNDAHRLFGFNSDALFILRISRDIVNDLRETSCPPQQCPRFSCNPSIRVCCDGQHFGRICHPC